MTEYQAKLKTLTTEQVIELMEQTDGMEGEEVFVVRGWLLDELEARNPAAFDEWMESIAVSPRRFFL